MDSRSQVYVPAVASAMSRVANLALVTALMLVGACTTTDAYTFGSSSLSNFGGNRRVYQAPASIRKSSGGKSRGVRKERENGSPVTLYLHRSQGSISSSRVSRSKKTRLPAMSHSVLADSDILPSFHTAHGILSPEVVMRIDDTHRSHLEAGEPLDRFLTKYKKEGPMACLPLLSDPCVLPELTKAMRDVM